MRNQNSEPTTGVYFQGIEVEVAGAFSHPEKGYLAEVVSTNQKVSRQHVSLWHLTFQDFQKAEEICKNTLNVNLKIAQARDQKKIGKKIVLKTVEPITPQQALAMC